ncbi:MAG: DUF1080 domain-containing protein [Planctomycetota bacterium]
MKALKNVAALALLALAAARTPPSTPLPPQDGDKWNVGLPQQHNSKWKVHDLRRPKPKAVAPAAQPGGPPDDAIVLFDGTSLAEWRGTKRGLWKVQDGAMEVAGTGSLRTVRSFGDCQLHLEYRAPTPATGEGQKRGNSGVIFMRRYEVQLLDNHENETYSDGYAGAVYGQHPPLANACRRPGEWQTYDIVFRAPRFADGRVSEPGRLTVFVNGVLAQHHAEIYGRVAWRKLAQYQPHGLKAPLALQDHGDRQPVRFRNIWIRELDLSPEAIDNR